MKEINKEIGIFLSVKEWCRLLHFLNMLCEDYIDFDSPMFQDLNKYMEIIARNIYDFE